uniref:SUZ domain-containing protein n=1 Tax=Sphenodon punctatus TaxID=8508 RepID=A0A8D0GND7_SPHPU
MLSFSCFICLSEHLLFSADSYLTAGFNSSTYITLLIFIFFSAQQNRIHPFRDDRRSKSIEEREEEYQRVREKIFAQDVSSCFNCLFSAISLSAVRQRYYLDWFLEKVVIEGCRESQG